MKRKQTITVDVSSPLAQDIKDRANALLSSSDSSETTSLADTKTLIESAFDKFIQSPQDGSIGSREIVSYYNEPWTTATWETVSSLFNCEYAQEKTQIAARRRGGMHEATKRVIIGRDRSADLVTVVAELVISQARRIGVGLSRSMSKGVPTVDKMQRNRNRQTGNAKIREIVNGLVEFVKSTKDTMPQHVRERYVAESHAIRKYRGSHKPAGA